MALACSHKPSLKEEDEVSPQRHVAYTLSKTRDVTLPIFIS